MSNLWNSTHRFWSLYVKNSCFSCATNGRSERSSLRDGFWYSNKESWVRTDFAQTGVWNTVPEYSNGQITRTTTEAILINHTFPLDYHQCLLLPNARRWKRQRRRNTLLALFWSGLTQLQNLRPFYVAKRRERYFAYQHEVNNRRLSPSLPHVSRKRKGDHCMYAVLLELERAC